MAKRLLIKFVQRTLNIFFIFKPGEIFKWKKKKKKKRSVAEFILGIVSQINNLLDCSEKASSLFG